ncbi:S-layer homology domain-containing protein [Paenibacillus sp. y28]
MALAFTSVVHAENAAIPANQSSAVKSIGDFKDLAGLPQDVKDKFDALISAGVFNGISEQEFGLNDKMNRAQFAKVAAIIFALPVDKTLTVSSFSDVTIDDPANGYALPFIEALKAAGLTEGVDPEGKMYNPSGTVTRQELAAFLIRGLQWKTDGTVPSADTTVDDWARSYITLALDNKLMSNVAVGAFGGQVYATRKMLALSSFEAKHAAETKAAPVVNSNAVADSALPAGITVLPVKIEIDRAVNVSVGDRYYDADGRISTTGQPPIINLKLTGPNNEEYSPSQVETLYRSGYIEVSTTGGVVLDDRAVGQSYVGQGRIVLKEVTAEGEASVTAKLTHVNDASSTRAFEVTAMRVPTTIEVNNKDQVVLAENDQPQNFTFTVKDQYGAVMKAPSALDDSSYEIEYKLERKSGQPSILSAGGIFYDTPWDEQKDAGQSVHTWQLPIDPSGEQKFMFKPNHAVLDAEGSLYELTATVVNKATKAPVASSTAALSVYNWKDIDSTMIYEIDLLGNHFASGSYLLARGEVSSDQDIETLNSKYPYFGKELNIVAYDEKRRRVDISKVLKNDAGQPISVVQSITGIDGDYLVGAQSVNASDIPVFRVYGVKPKDLFDIDVNFYTPGGTKKLTKRQLTVELDEPVTKAVAVKNPTMNFDLNTVYSIRKPDGSVEQIKGSDYLASKPYVWEFLRFADNNGEELKDESQFFRYFIQATDQFGHKYQNTSDQKMMDFSGNLDMLQVKVMIDMDNKFPPKWSVNDAAQQDKIWVDEEFRLHYEPHAKNADGSFDYANKNLESFSIELVSPTLARSWCTVTLNY